MLNNQLAVRVIGAGPETVKHLTKAEVGKGVFHIGDETPPGVHARVGHIFERQGNTGLALARGTDAMSQSVAVEEHQTAGGDLDRPRNHGCTFFPCVQLIIEAAGGVVDHAQQQRVAPAGVVRRIVVPTDVIAGTRIKVERVSVRVIGRRELQAFARQIIQPAPQSRGAVEFGNDRRLRVDGVSADAATLLMTRQIIAVHRLADSGSGIDQSRRHFGRQEIFDIEKSALPDVFAAQPLHVEGVQPGS
jgi:hypothetical protein